MTSEELKAYRKICADVVRIASWLLVEEREYKSEMWKIKEIPESERSSLDAQLLAAVEIYKLVNPLSDATLPERHMF